MITISLSNRELVRAHRAGVKPIQKRGRIYTMTDAEWKKYVAYCKATLR